MRVIHTKQCLVNIENFNLKSKSKLTVHPINCEKVGEHVVYVDEALLEHLSQIAFAVTQAVENEILHVVLTELGAQRAGMAVENGEVQQIGHEFLDPGWQRERESGK